MFENSFLELFWGLPYIFYQPPILPLLSYNRNYLTPFFKNLNCYIYVWLKQTFKVTQYKTNMIFVINELGNIWNQLFFEFCAPFNVTIFLF